MYKSKDEKIPLTPEDLHKVITEAIEEGRAHATSSPETINALKNMNDKVEEIKIETKEQGKDIEYIKSDLSEIKSDFKEFGNTMTAFIEKAHDSFATKREHTRLEGFVHKITWVFGFSVIGFFMKISWELFRDLIIKG